jgi:hypothetical protein
VSLRWKINDLNATAVPIQIRLSDSDFSSFAAREIVCEHLWKALFEFESDAFPHHADAIDGIDSRLRFRLEEIADECFEHGRARCWLAKK